MKRLLLLLLPLICAACQAQTVEALDNGLGRLTGTDEAMQTQFTRLFLSAQPRHALDLSQPTLTFECSVTPGEKPRLEVFVNFGNVTDLGYHAPWKPTPLRPNRPKVVQIPVTMQFLGYTRYKPQRRSFERLSVPEGQLRYRSPGLRSPNLEDFTFYLQVLRALPTLRVSDGEHTADFLTTPLLEQLRREPLCSTVIF